MYTRGSEKMLSTTVAENAKVAIVNTEDNPHRCMLKHSIHLSETVPTHQERLDAAMRLVLRHMSSELRALMRLSQDNPSERMREPVLLKATVRQPKLRLKK